MKTFNVRNCPEKSSLQVCQSQTNQHMASLPSPKYNVLMYIQLVKLVKVKLACTVHTLLLPKCCLCSLFIHCRTQMYAAWSHRILKALVLVFLEKRGIIMEKSKVACLHVPMVRCMFVHTDYLLTFTQSAANNI